MNPDHILARLARLPAGAPFDRPLSALPVKENVYRLRAGTRDYLLKWMPDDRPGPHAELAVNRTHLGHADDIAPRLLWSEELDGGSLACWEWLEGEDLREQREQLPEAFALLGAFHARRRCEGPLFVAGQGQPHASVDALVTAEQARLLPLVEPALRNDASRLLDRLRAGYGTLVHGDMHPGNMLRTADGLRFVDWSLAQPALNFADLDYIESVVLEPQARGWPYMPPEEAGPLLHAYATTCSIERLDIHRVHGAVMLWREIGALAHHLGQAERPSEAVRDRRARLAQLLAWNAGDQ